MVIESPVEKRGFFCFKKTLLEGGLTVNSAGFIDVK
jgi:hypothetical protein